MGLRSAASSCAPMLAQEAAGAGCGGQRPALVGRRRADRREADRARVGEREAAWRERRAVLVREALGEDRARRLGVVGLAEVAPGALAGACPRRFWSASQRERRVDLAAAAEPEDPADQRRLGDHVGQLPRLRQRPERGVLGGHQLGGEQRVLGLLDVGVDPGDVVLPVLHELGALRAVQRRRGVDLRLEVRLGVRRDRPLRLVHRAVRGRAAGERRERSLGRVTQHVHQEQPVLGARVPGAEHHLGARLAVDVGDVVLVADDRQPGLGALGAGDVLRPARRTWRP